MCQDKFKEKLSEPSPDLTFDYVLVSISSAPSLSRLARSYILSPHPRVHWLFIEQASRSWPPVYVSGQIQLRTRSTNSPLATSLSDYLLRLASSATLPRRTSAPQVRLTNQLLGETLLWILFFLLDRRHVAGHLQFACQDKSKSEISPSLLYLTH
jgi:hypothetical protein